MKRFETVIEGGLFLCAMASVATTVGIVAVLLFETIEFLREAPVLDSKFSSFEASGLKFTITDNPQQNRFEIVVTQPAG